MVNGTPTIFPARDQKQRACDSDPRDSPRGTFVEQLVKHKRRFAFLAWRMNTVDGLGPRSGIRVAAWLPPRITFEDGNYGVDLRLHIHLATTRPRGSRNRALAVERKGGYRVSEISNDRFQ